MACNVAGFPAGFCVSTLQSNTRKKTPKIRIFYSLTLKNNIWGLAALLLLRQAQQYLILPSLYHSLYTCEFTFGNCEFFSQDPVRLMTLEHGRNSEIMEHLKHVYCVDATCSPSRLMTNHNVFLLSHLNFVSWVTWHTYVLSWSCTVVKMATVLVCLFNFLHLHFAFIFHNVRVTFFW